MMDDDILTVMIIVNSIISLMILCLVAPLYQIRGTLAQVTATMKHHETRLLSIEERINGR